MQILCAEHDFHAAENHFVFLSIVKSMLLLAMYHMEF